MTIPSEKGGSVGFMGKYRPLLDLVSCLLGAVEQGRLSGVRPPAVIEVESTNQTRLLGCASFLVSRTHHRLTLAEELLRSVRIVEDTLMLHVESVLGCSFVPIINI